MLKSALKSTKTVLLSVLRQFGFGGIAVPLSYDPEFARLVSDLTARYPAELFEMEGINSQLDMAHFSRKFFNEVEAKNLADLSVDANANVEETSIIAYNVEFPKPYLRLNSLYLIWKYMRKLFGDDAAEKAIEMQISGDFYINDFTGVQAPYCFNFSTYDVMLNGLPFVKKIQSKPPKHLSSFIGQLIHFSVYASNSVLGAVGLADALLVSSYYVRKLFNDNGRHGIPEEYTWAQVKQELQSLIFSCNQPFRGGVQSGFYNISVYDRYFLENMQQYYSFPDGSTIDIDLTMRIQELFVDLMNETLEASLFTFPIVTACFSVDEAREIRDHDFLRMISEKNTKFGFINIFCGESSVLSSCCRLRSDMKSEYFNQFGAGSTKIGSLGVVTLNLPRLAVKAEGNLGTFYKSVTDLAEIAIKVNQAKRYILKKRAESGALPLYKLGFMALQKQYGTLGVTGCEEVCQFFETSMMEDAGQRLISSTLDLLNEINEHYSKEYNVPLNLEQVPAENSAIKLASKDKILGYQDRFNIYSNQFIPLHVNADMLDRIRLQGMFDARMSGGAICHINVDQRIEDPKKIADLILTCSKMGVVYWAVNYNLQKCEDGHISVGREENCATCGKPITDNYTRVVGFLVNTKNFHKVRREQEYPSRQFYSSVN